MYKEAVCRLPGGISIWGILDFGEGWLIMIGYLIAVTIIAVCIYWKKLARMVVCGAVRIAVLSNFLLWDGWRFHFLRAPV
jgi:hypothetical protein